MAPGFVLVPSFDCIYSKDIGREVQSKRAADRPWVMLRAT